MFKVGQKVICTDASSPEAPEFYSNWITENEIYTIRERSTLFGKNRVLLEEVRNPSVYIQDLMGKIEAGFDAKRFVDAEEYFLENVNIEEELLTIQMCLL